MSSAAGLSRRRVATASTSSVSGDDLASPGRNANGSASNGAVATHAGSAFEGGNKIAFDPRDLDQDREDSRYGGKMPRLTIMEEVLLLGLKDKHVCTRLFGLFAALHHPCHLCLRFPQHER
jgi:Golgi phosphoprotein 3